MAPSSRHLPSHDGATALDAAEVKALFASLRSSPRALAELRRAFDRLGGRLTPSGRAAYERELARLLSERPITPSSLDELVEGEYGLAVRGDDGTEVLSSLRFDQGRLQLELPLARPAAICLLEVAPDGRIAGRHLASGGTLMLSLRGALAVQEGYLLLTLEVTGVAQGRPVRLSLSGTGAARPTRA